MMNRHTICASVLVSAGILLAAPAVHAAQPLNIGLNESRYLEVGGLSRVAVGNPDVADVQLISGNELLVVGKKAGSTTLLVWSGGTRQEYIVVVSGADAGLAEMIQNAIGLPGVTVQMVGKKVLLKGVVMNQHEKDMALKIASLYVGDEDVATSTSNTSDVNNSDNKGASATDKTNSNIIDMLQMAKPSQIRLEAQIIEVSSSKAADFGLEYGSYTDDAGATKMGASGTFYGGENWITRDWGGWLVRHTAQINATVRALITQGKARILSRPNISTMSGEKAKILIGGSIPVPVSNDGSISIQWREYGVKLDIEPVVDEMEKITSRVHAEVSTLDYSHAVTENGFTIPALATREADSVIHVSNGMTMVIGGLMNSEESKTVSKIPLLGNIPILGEFFKYTSTNRDKRELIILITPHLVGEDTPARMSDRMKQVYNEGQAEAGAANRVNVNTTEPEVEKEIARIKEKRAEEKAKKEQKAAEKEARKAAKETAKLKASRENGRVENPKKSSFRERVDAILQEQKAQDAAASYEPVPDNHVTIVMPQEEAVPAKSGEEAALGNYLNR
ncbi:MAG: pilus assembly protein N-terminal domain-containing protein [Acidaminococcaceae bacterium]|nr:pilus assembly protein N-terminal domain-containing protein [Acidaminococcaceae bacterium]